jgi:hypothetical protein
MMSTSIRGIALFAILLVGGCCPFSVTAVSEAESCKGGFACHDQGIPFYLPKPLLVISKNFNCIETPTVGLTQPVPIPNQFDKQDTFATLSAQAGISTTSAAKQGDGNTPAPAAQMRTRLASGNDQSATSDSCCPTQILHSAGSPVVPNTDSKIQTGATPFFTYQIVFVPDLTQKHYLRIKGGPGEVRATLNMVNGWMFTGLGPFYLKDSSTAQNILATGVLAKFAGSGAADIINSVADLSKTLQTGPAGGASGPALETMLRHNAQILEKLAQEKPVDNPSIVAEIHVYEPHLTPEGAMEWREINCGHTDMSGQCVATTPRVDAKSLAPLLFTPADFKDVFSRQDAKSAIQYTVGNPFDPAFAQTDKAALQALAPPAPQQRPGLFGWLCHPKQLTNSTVTGPTVVAAPGAVPVVPQPQVAVPAVCAPAAAPAVSPITAPQVVPVLPAAPAIAAPQVVPAAPPPMPPAR